MIRPIHFTTHLCSVLLAVQLSFQTKSFGWRCTIRQKTRPLTCHYSCHILKITSSLSDYSLTYKLISHILIVILLFVNFSICGAHMYTSVNVMYDIWTQIFCIHNANLRHLVYLVFSWARGDRGDFWACSGEDEIYNDKLWTYRFRKVDI